MRDINRISVITDHVAYVWKTYFPDWRFCQLMSNFDSYIRNLRGVDMFHVEDDEFTMLLDTFVNISTQKIEINIEQNKFKN